MKTKFLGIGTILLGLFVILVPLFTKCKATSMMTMRCNYTAQAEIAVSIPVVMVGAGLILSKSKESLRFLTLAGIASGISVILLPTVLIGACKPPMHCATIMKPALILFGSLLIGGNLVGLLFSFKAERVKNEHSPSDNT